MYVTGCLFCYLICLKKKKDFSEIVLIHRAVMFSYHFAPRRKLMEAMETPPHLCTPASGFDAPGFGGLLAAVISLPRHLNPVICNVKSASDVLSLHEGSGLSHPTSLRIFVMRTRSGPLVQTITSMMCNVQ